MSRVTARSVGYPEDFLTWWKTYPPLRRTGKKKTLERWNRAITHVGETHGLSRAEAIIRLQQITETFAKSEKGRGRYCPGCQVWLHQGQYDDDVESWGGSGDTNLDTLSRYLNGRPNATSASGDPPGRYLGP